MLESEYILSEERKFLLNAQYEKHMSHNELDQAYKCKQEIQKIEIPEDAHKQWQTIMQTYDATLHLLNVLNMSLTYENRQSALSKYAKLTGENNVLSVEQALDQLKKIEQIFETPSNNPYIMYEFEEQLISKRVLRNNGIYRTQLEKIQEIVNIACDWTQKKSGVLISFRIPNMELDKFTVDKRILFDNFILYTRTNKIQQTEFLSDSVEKLNHILSRSLPYGYKYGDVHFKPSYKSRSMSNSLALIYWIDNQFKVQKEKEQVITKLPDRTWTYMFFSLLQAGALHEVWESIENKTLHTALELIDLSKSNIIPYVTQTPTNKLITEYMIFASNLHDLFLLSEKYSHIPIVFDFSNFEPILIGGKLPIKLNITTNEIKPRIIGMKDRQER